MSKAAKLQLEILGMGAAQMHDPEQFKANCIEFAVANRNARRRNKKMLKRVAKKNKAVRAALNGAAAQEGNDQ